MKRTTRLSMILPGFVIIVLLTSFLPTLAAPPAATLSSAVVAYDMVNSASQNLVSYSNPWTNAFGSAGDGFQKYQRWVSPSIPYSVLDDSLSIFPPDSLGIIKEGNTDIFFGVTDTVNGDNSDPVSATWVFDISGASGLSLSIDMGAMGDFESSDTFQWTYAIDGGPTQTAFASAVDEAGSYTYTLEGGASFTLNDPLLVDGVVLSNDLQTFTTDLDGSGSQLTLTLTADTNGGSEAFVFQNLKISGVPGPPGPTPTPTVPPTPTPPPACGSDFTPIYEIQGTGLASSLDGSAIVTEGIVTGDFQEGKSGYFIQDLVGDGDPDSSDGVFVFDGNSDVSPGDYLRVYGTVDEYYDLTEITSVSEVLVCGSELEVSPVAVELPVSDVLDLEAYEGMLVTFPQQLFITEYYEFDRYGEIVVATSRQMTPSALYDPDSPEAAQALLDNELARIKVDDGRGSQNPDPAIHPNGSIFDLGNLFRGGDTLTNLTGVVDFNFGEYKIQPTVGTVYQAANPRPLQPDYVGAGLKVASFNVLNYFTTLGSRGADTVLEFERQRAKIFAALAEMDADVVGLIEIENNLAAIQDLVAGLNEIVGPGTYDYVDTGVIGPDEIKVAFIYKPAAVSLWGDYAVLDTPEFLDPAGIGDPKNRPALAQSFQDNQTGGIFTVVVNHLKSKGSECGPGDDHPIAGSCNLTRTLAAEILVDWLAGDPTGSGDGDVLIIGDLNAYDKEDPIDVLVSAGYNDLVFDILGENAYSYVFDGQLGYLDHGLAMVNTEMSGEISGLTVWHINADEPDLIDYDMTWKKDAQDALFAPDPFRSSDHDPVLIGVDVCDEIPPEVEVSATPDELWPANHKMVDVTTTVVVNDNFDPDPLISLVSVTSNQQDNDIGDGNSEEDFLIIDDFHFQLRAERSATSQEARVYTITYLVVDACGNETEVSVEVVVPFNQSDKEKKQK